jgi:hypothetical protein
VLRKGKRERKRKRERNEEMYVERETAPYLIREKDNTYFDTDEEKQFKKERL